MTSKDDYNLPKNAIVGGKWKILEKLGEGGFGAVYRVIDTSRSPESIEQFAMKVESATCADQPMLKMEAFILKMFRARETPCEHICRYVESGGWSSIWFIVMQLVGRSVSDLRRSCPNGRFTSNTTARLSCQALQALESLHSIGFVHRDVKPSNLAMGLEGAEKRLVYLLDFGLARQYVRPDGELRPPRKVAGFRGTVRYASINTHLRKDLGRRDDLWSLLYVMVEFRRGELPWRRAKGKNEVLKVKKSLDPEQLLADMEPEYRLMYDDLMRLKFEDAPNYDRFRERLRNVAERDRQDAADGDPFDWEQGGVAYESMMTSTATHSCSQTSEEGDEHLEREKMDESDDTST